MSARVLIACERSRLERVMSPDLHDKLFRCWYNGMGLHETGNAVARAFGFRPDPETVRQHFVEFAETFTGQTASAT